MLCFQSVWLLLHEKGKGQKRRWLISLRDWCGGAAKCQQDETRGGVFLQAARGPVATSTHGEPVKLGPARYCWTAELLMRTGMCPRNPLHVLQGCRLQPESDYGAQWHFFMTHRLWWENRYFLDNMQLRKCFLGTCQRLSVRKRILAANTTDLLGSLFPSLWAEIPSCSCSKSRRRQNDFCEAVCQKSKVLKVSSPPWPRTSWAYVHFGWFSLLVLTGEGVVNFSCKLFCRQPNFKRIFNTEGFHTRGLLISLQDGFSLLCSWQRMWFDDCMNCNPAQKLNIEQYSCTDWIPWIFFIS